MTYHTYLDLKKNVLIRMGEDKNVSDSGITETTTIIGYLKAFPDLLRDALALLSTAGRYIPKMREIIIDPAENQLNIPASEIRRVVAEPVILRAVGCSWYIEAAGQGTITVTDGVTTTTHPVAAEAMTTYKGVLSTEEREITITLTAGPSPMLYRGAAIYRETYATADDVYVNSDTRRIDLVALTGDFFKLNVTNTESEYYAIHETAGIDYTWETDRVLVVNNRRPAVWRIAYFAYPQIVPASPADDMVLEVMPEVYTILPLYIEGKLRQINDEDYAMTVLSEFEQRRAELLVNDDSTKSRAKVVRGGRTLW